jgi:hypothetical protein
MDPLANALPGQALSPLDMSRIAAYTPYTHGLPFDLGTFGGGFTDNDAPLYSAGLATPATMWGNSDFFLTPDFNDLSRHDDCQGPTQMFDFTPAAEQYLEQAADLTPNLGIASSGDVSEADDNQSPSVQDVGEFLQDRGIDYGGMIPRPEILDDATLYYTFDDELQALGYNEATHAADKRPEYNNYWVPSP